LDIKPDLMPMAKGLTSGYAPLSAVMVNDEIVKTLGDAGDFQHGFTYSGHPVSCAVALANIELIKREGMVETVRDDTGPYFAEKLKEVAEHPLVGEARSIGLMAGVELVKDKASRTLFDNMGDVGAICRDHCTANGLISRATRDVMVMSPPLCITREEIDILIERLMKSIDATAKDVGIA